MGIVGIQDNYVEMSGPRLEAAPASLHVGGKVGRNEEVGTAGAHHLLNVLRWFSEQSSTR